MAETDDKKTSETPVETPKVEEKPKEKAPTPAEVFTPEKVVEAPKVEETPKAETPNYAAEIAAMQAQVAALTEANKAAAKEKAEMERQLMTAAAADKYRLSDEAREFLSGNTAEDLEQRAKKLASLSQAAPVIGKGGLDPNDTTRSLADLSPAELAARIPKNYF
ncbi:hypothetical protein [Streptomyces sp. NPDC127112]|uniref:hypothetical protein n=1 Tax=Streptomyces sp. NPDC127112 TaxID=3345364 RepID=UPI0036429A21